MGLGGGIYDGDKTMAKNFALNQLICYEFRSPGVGIGSNINGTLDYVFDIFDPELALIGKLDKIPILRSLRIQITDVPDLYIAMAGDTGNISFKWLLQLFNDNQYNNPENPGGLFIWNGKKPGVIGTASRSGIMVATVGDVQVYYETNHFHMQFQGGIPLKPRCMLRNELGFANLVAGRAWASGEAGHGMIFMEIDWKDVNKAEFDDYIREYIFSQE